MNLEEEASRIDGYLLAIAALKEDGTSFRCVYLGEGEPSGKVAEVSARLGFERGAITLVPRHDALTPENIPKGLEDWLLDRSFATEEGPPIDRRLVSALVAELEDIFRTMPSWFSVERTAEYTNFGQHGAVWSMYVLGLAVGSCAIHCSWDR